jgi:hypothetical protein
MAWALGVSGGDWEMMTESLVKNMNTNNIQVEDDGNFLRVV